MISLCHGGGLPFIIMDVAPGGVYSSSALTWHPKCFLSLARRWVMDWWKPPTCEASDGVLYTYFDYWVIVEAYSDNSLSPSIAI